MSYSEKRSSKELMYEEMWNLDTSVVKGAWWWWWWIFFIRNNENPKQSKQLMILWSTKNVDKIKVNDFEWKRRKLPVREDDGVMRFNGMTAAWYYDGEKMVEPLVLRDSDFEVHRNKDGRGRLHPIIENCNYDFEGGPDNMSVYIQDDKSDIHLGIKPVDDNVSKFIFRKNRFGKKYHYSILKQYMSSVNGKINGDDVTGTGYFQKLLVNAPQPPWYWVINHFENGSYIDYMYANIGLQMLRKKEKHKTFLDRFEIPVTKGVVFYHRPTNTTYKFKKMKIWHEYENDLPIFYIDAKSRDGKGHIHLKYECYSRAYWRFQQKGTLSKNVLYYNEYPSTLTEFDMKYGDLHLTRDDMGYSASNNEHAWGRLF